MVKWIKCEDRLPPEGEPVLLIHTGLWDPNMPIIVGVLVRDHPAHDEIGYGDGSGYLYWDDYHNDGQGWEWSHITHWMQLPDLPKSDNKQKE